MALADFSKELSQNKERLQEIGEQVDSENVSTDDLLSMLEEAVNIGMDVCEQVKEKVVLDEKSEQDKNDGGE
ncbi:hypothetical protein [Phoenicibacter congonensis]|uniref:hypothetical protein n=1 Tax=Phoenicibacter congonensis TaxID=1944646 RepID=UPI0009A8984D|nr:hypothetical protein [Phoenicibacter congonensis]